MFGGVGYRAHTLPGSLVARCSLVLVPVVAFLPLGLPQRSRNALHTTAFLYNHGSSRPRPSQIAAAPPKTTLPFGDFASVCNRMGREYPNSESTTACHPAKGILMIDSQSGTCVRT